MIALYSLHLGSLLHGRRGVRRLAFRLGLLALLAAAATATLSAAPKSPGSEPSEPAPVEVTNVVDVIGAVDIVSESHKQPFWLSVSGIVPAGQANSLNDLTLPENKRLVIEAVTVWTKVSTGARPMAWLSLRSRHPGISSKEVALTFTEQGPWDGGTLFTVTAPITLRINTTDWDLLMNQFRMGGSAEARYRLTLAGYMEDL